MDCCVSLSQGGICCHRFGVAHYAARPLESFGSLFEGRQRIVVVPFAIMVDDVIDPRPGVGQQFVDGRNNVLGADLIEGDSERDVE